MRRLALLLPLPFLALAALAGARLEIAREDAGIPRSAARVPLGGFEPVAVTLLWLRQAEFTSDRRLSEAVAAIRLITELQPRVPEAWELLAWILAWKVSESSADPEEQWRWTEEAIAVLLRGLEHNPGSPKILWTLGMVYFQRISEYPAIREVAELRLGEPPEAAALRLFRGLSLGDPGYGPPAWMRAESATRLGIVRARRGEREGAIRVLEEALPIWEEVAREPDAEKARERLGAVRGLLESLRSR